MRIGRGLPSSIHRHARNPTVRPLSDKLHCFIGSSAGSGQRRANNQEKGQMVKDQLITATSQFPWFKRWRRRRRRLHKHTQWSPLFNSTWLFFRFKTQDTSSEWSPTNMKKPRYTTDSGMNVDLICLHLVQSGPDPIHCYPLCSDGLWDKVNEPLFGRSVLSLWVVWRANAGH